MSSNAAGGRQRSTYQVAIDATQRTIDARARAYRNLVIAVTLTLITPIVIALITWSWLPLLGLGLIFPLYDVFAVSDGQLVLAWQRHVLSLWTDQQLDFAPLRDALRGVPRMPTRTLDGMLTTLPLPSSPNAPEVRAQPLRRVVAFVARESHVMQHVRFLLSAVVRLVSLVLIVLAVALGSWLPLLGLLAIPLALATGAAWTALARRRWSTQIAAARAAGFDCAQLRRELGTVQCGDAAEPFIRQLSAAAEQSL